MIPRWKSVLMPFNKALVLAAQEQKYRSLLLRTHSIFFLGTPHRGTKLASFGSMLSNCAAALGMGSSNELLKNLRESADDVQNTVGDFAIQAREYNIDLVCFYELYPTKLMLNRLLRPTFSTMVRKVKTEEWLPGVVSN